MSQGHFFGETVKRAVAVYWNLAIFILRMWRNRAVASVFVLFTTTAAGAFVSDDDTDFPGADAAGPMLTTSRENPSVEAYNNAVVLYRQEKYPEALEQMRAAVRAQEFGPQNIGLAFSNLCLMYLKVGKYRNAEAACTRALRVLPNFVPATINLERAKARLKPPEE